MTTPAFTHDEVQDLLGPMADGELPAALAERAGAHVAACSRCARAVALQAEIRRKVASCPVPPSPAALLLRVGAALDREEAPPAPAPRERAWPWRAAPWSGWAVAAALLAALLLAPREPGSGARAPAPPMVRSALADYRRVTRDVLPRACDEGGRPDLPFAGAPLRSADVRPVSCWRATLQGEAVSAWAYRWGNRVVVAYVVPEALFFRQPQVRQAVARDGRYAASDGDASVVAWPAERTGVLVVGDASSSELATLRLGS